MQINWRNWMAEYRVPKRFSIAEILALMTVLSFTFAGLRLARAPASMFLFLGGQAVLICLVQMRFGNVPREASAIVGSIGMPIWVWTMLLLGHSAMPAGFEGRWIDVPLIALCGAVLGYLTGAVLAGVFLIADLLEPRIRRVHHSR